MTSPWSRVSPIMLRSCSRAKSWSKAPHAGSFSMLNIRIPGRFLPRCPSGRSRALQGVAHEIFFGPLGSLRLFAGWGFVAFVPADATRARRLLRRNETQSADLAADNYRLARAVWPRPLASRSLWSLAAIGGSRGLRIFLRLQQSGRASAENARAQYRAPCRNFHRNRLAAGSGYRNMERRAHLPLGSPPYDRNYV